MGDPLQREASGGLPIDEFFYALCLTNQLTFPPQLAGFQRLEQVNWSALAAAGVLGVIPPVLQALIFQRYMVAGLSRGAVKG